ncbi:MAG: type II secretion system major pseudopilin GspG [Verrucomicrobiia bacterium]
MKLRWNKQSGFTLIEIMLVIAIIALLVGTVIVNIGPQRKKAYETQAKNQISAYKMALQTYSLDNGIYPTTDQGLQALVAAPTSEPVPAKWHGPYTDPAVIKPDPWNRAYIYVCPPQQNPDPEGFDLYSSGLDGRPNTDDDIVSWR